MGIVVDDDESPRDKRFSDGSSVNGRNKQEEDDDDDDDDDNVAKLGTGPSASQGLRRHGSLNSLVSVASVKCVAFVCVCHVDCLHSIACVCVCLYVCVYSLLLRLLNYVLI